MTILRRALRRGGIATFAILVSFFAMDKMCAAQGWYVVQSSTSPGGGTIGFNLSPSASDGQFLGGSSTASTTNADGTFTTTFYYEAPAGTVPPSSLLIDENLGAGVDAQWTGGLWDTPLPLITNVNDGFGDAATPVWFTQPFSNFGYGGIASMGNHLVSLPVTVSTGTDPAGNTFTGTASNTRNITADGNVPNPATYSYLDVYSFCWDTMTSDTRSLIISAGTSGKVLQFDTVDGADTFPVVDEYGNPQYKPGPEPTTLGGAARGDVGLIENDEESTDTVVSYVAIAPGDWKVPGSTAVWSDTVSDPDPVEDGPNTNFDQTLSAGDSIAPIYISYQNPCDGGAFYDNNGGNIKDKDDNVQLTYTDGTGSDHASAVAKLCMHFHWGTEATQAPGQPTDPTDPNYFYYYVTAISWPCGQPTNDTQSYEIDTTAPSDIREDCEFAGNAIEIVAAGAKVFATTDLEIEPWAGIAELAGLSLDAVAAGISNKSSSLSRGILFPTADTHPYPNQWGSGNPVEFPSYSGSMVPPDWNPTTTTKPSDISEKCFCSPYNIDRYKRTLYAVDNWGATGYVGYTQKFLDTWNDETTIGVWTWTKESGG